MLKHLMTLGGVAFMMSVLPACEDRTHDADSNEPTPQSATTADDVRREAQDATDTAQQYTEEEIQTFRQRMAEHLDEAKQRIASLQQQTDELAEDARDEYQQQLDELTTKREQLQSRIESLNASGAQAWSDLKANLQRSWDELQRAIDRAAAMVDGEQGQTPSP